LVLSSRLDFSPVRRVGLGEFIGKRTVPTRRLAYAPAVVWLPPAPSVLLWTLVRRRGVPVALADLGLVA
jgi:vancomycin resistance protein VanJ